MPQFPFCGNFNFIVEVEDLDADVASAIGGFSQASGLVSESDVLEHRVGSRPETLKIPGRVHYGNIVLRKGVTSSTELYRWRQRIERGEQDVRSGSIVLLDAAMQEKARWNFHGGWPCRYEGPLLDAQDNTVSIETLELAVERLERVDVGEGGR